VRVLDVAAGDGNLAVAAARRGAAVSACDLTPRMVELGRARSAAAGLAIEWVEADVEDLPFPAGGFDVVASAFGAIFAPRPHLAAEEMFRVVRPRGLVAMANYAEAGVLGRITALASGPCRRRTLPSRRPTSGATQKRSSVASAASPRRWMCAKGPARSSSPPWRTESGQAPRVRPAAGRAARAGPDHRRPPHRLHVEQHAQMLARVGRILRVQRRQLGPFGQLVVGGVVGRLEDVVLSRRLALKGLEHVLQRGIRY